MRCWQKWSAKKNYLAARAVGNVGKIERGQLSEDEEAKQLAHRPKILF